MKPPKIQTRLILDLESPSEINGTLRISIRASEPQMLTKVNSYSKIHNLCNFGPQIFVSTPKSTPKLHTDPFRHSKADGIDGNPIRVPKLQMARNRTFDQTLTLENSTFQNSTFYQLFLKPTSKPNQLGLGETIGGAK